MKSLQQIWDDMPLKTDKGSVHSYIEHYERILAPYRETATNVLEIGLFNGASMLMWEKYFTKANIYGIDCSETPHNGLADLRPLIAEGNHNIIIGDATDDKFLKEHFTGKFIDVVIDDGNHNIMSQLKSFEIIFPYLSNDGIYIIEDIENIDDTRWVFEGIEGVNVEILDLRGVKNRFDDVLVILKP